MGTGYPWQREPTQLSGRPENPEDKPTEQRLIGDYQGLRLDIADLETFIASDGTGLDEDELKRLDKSIVLMKTGAKILKKVLRARGYRELKPAALRIQA